MTSKRVSGGLREENYEHVLMCLICRSLFDDYDHQPKFLPCHHTFCKDCLREYVKQAGDEIECPSCRKIATIPTAGVVALQTNYYVKYIQSLVYGPSGSEIHQLECDVHPHAKLVYYCKDCNRSICNKCSDGSGKSECSSDHKKVPLTAINEECNQKLETAFARANGVIEAKKVELEAVVKALSEEKDQCMKKIDSTFEQYVHTLSRRSTLLKNKVIAIYNEHLEKLEADLEEISTAMTCIVSLKEYHENMIGNGHYLDLQKGIAEMDEVFGNIKMHIQPKEVHIVYEDKHGVDKFRGSAKDLGRVRSNRPMIARAEPEGVDAGTRAESLDQPSPTTPGDIVSDTDYSPGYTSEDAIETQGAVGGMGAVGGASPPEAYTTFEPTRSEPRPSSRCDSGAGQPPNAHGHETNKLDINSNTPITVPGVVRPKTLSSKSSSNVMSSSTSSASIKSSGTQNGYVNKRTDKRIMGSGGGSSSTGSTMSKSGLYILQHADQEQYSLSALRPDHAQDPDIEGLKQTDKMYHHLVYTSYDEEELLKELKCGKVHFDQTATAARATGPPPGRTMEDSDSWMTVSTDSTISCNSEESTEDQSRL